MPFPFVLLLVLAVPQTAPNEPKPDALSLLNEVSQRYADAKSYHIEAVEEHTSSNELQHGWQKTLLAAILYAGRTLPVRGTLGLRRRHGCIGWNYPVVLPPE